MATPQNGEWSLEATRHAKILLDMATRLVFVHNTEIPCHFLMLHGIAMNCTLQRSVIVANTDKLLVTTYIYTKVLQIMNICLFGFWGLAQNKYLKMFVISIKLECHKGSPTS